MTESIPMKRQSTNQIKLPGHIKTLIKERNHSRRKYQRTRDNQFKIAQTELTREIYDEIKKISQCEPRNKTEITKH